jgi:hypothetical protein
MFNVRMPIRTLIHATLERIASLVVGALCLAGCDVRYDTVRRVMPVATTLPAGSAGQVRLIFDNRVLTGRFNAAGIFECSDANVWLECRWRVADDGSGHLLLMAPSSQASASYIGGKGAWLNRPHVLEVRADGFRPSHALCRWVSGHHSHMQSFLLEIELDETTHDCGPLTFLPARPGDPQFSVAAPNTGPRPGLRQVTVQTNGDYPVEAVLRAHVDGYTQPVHVAAGCPLPGVNGGVAASVVSQTASAQAHTINFEIDANQLRLQPGHGHVELLVRPLGPGRLGDTGLSVTTQAARVAATLSMPASNDTALTEQGHYRALQLPLLATTLPLVADEMLDAMPQGSCAAQAVRVESVSAATTGTVVHPGDAVDIDIRFSAPVSATSAHLRLETGAEDRIATLVSGSGSNTLRLRYVVQPGDRSERLTAFSRDALTVAAAPGIVGPNGDAVRLTLPAEGSPGALGLSAVVVVPQ